MAWRRALSAGPSKEASRHSLHELIKEILSEPTVKALRSPREGRLVVRSCQGHSTSSKPCSAAQALSITMTLPAMGSSSSKLRGIIAFTIARLTDFQNLIPLCIRPFRLILPSERLRSARIVLLKATHLPFVGAIWAYEQLADAHARKREKNVMSFSGPQTPVPSKRPPRLPVNSPRLLMADPQVAPNTPGRGQHINRPHTTAGLTDSDPQLKTLVLKLTTQVEELTAIVSQLKGQGERRA